ncbi:MAG: metallophosphoesterase [Firmicutes bacterium]|nr:metallophosphoesterase [Bacillota bacterium]
MMKQLLNFLRPFFIYLLVIAGTLFFIQYFARTSFTDGYLSFDLRPRLGCEGGVSINIPPLGQLFYKSHRAPWRLVFTVQAINFKKFESSWLSSFTPKQGLVTFFHRKELVKAIWIFTLSIIGFGLLGACIILLLFRVPILSPVFRNGMLLSLAVILLFIGSTILTFDSNFTEQVHYQGLMASAPWMMNIFANGMEVIRAIGNHLKNISAEFPLLVQQADQMKDLENLPVDLRLLHVSDIHNNPAAIDLISNLATKFNIDLIIDTGDITDWGTPFELAVAQKIAGLNIPYLFIPGNHDSPMVVARLKKLRRVKVVTSGVVKVNGLTIAGFADPASYKYSSNMASEAELNQACRNFAEYLSKQSMIPDIVAVHNVKLASEVIGKVPVILHGHDHQYRLTVNDGSIIIDAGTTGAAGIRGLKPEGVPYSAAILYWGKNDQGALKLRKVDSIKINGAKGFFTIDRQAFK